MNHPVDDHADLFIAHFLQELDAFFVINERVDVVDSITKMSDGILVSIDVGIWPDKKTVLRHLNITIIPFSCAVGMNSRLSCLSLIA